MVAPARRFPVLTLHPVQAPYQVFPPAEFRVSSRVCYACSLQSPMMPQLLWTQKQDIGPGLRSRFDMVFDSSRMRVVLFGGQIGTVGSKDTWEWNGEEWTQTADIGPSPRFGHSLAYDSNRGC